MGGREGGIEIEGEREIKTFFFLVFWGFDYTNFRTLIIDVT